MGNHRNNSSLDDDLQDLLHQVGSREEPPFGMTEEVREAVHAEWRGLVANRSRQRRTTFFSIAASVIFAVILAGGALYWGGLAAGPVASVAKVEGTPEVQSEAGSSAVRAAVDMEVNSGDRIRTLEGSRIALAFGPLSVRVDERSTIEVAAVDRLVLHAGAVYVDAGANAAVDNDLVIVTSAGDVQHVGTQYQVRQRESGIVISVREGRVRIDREALATIDAAAGEMVSIARSGAVERGAISSQDASWQWTRTVAPSFNIDNRSLAAFLDWFSRETGKKIIYASPQAQVEAGRVVLRGSIEAMDPQTAMEVVLSTTTLRASQSNDESVELELIPR